MKTNQLQQILLKEIEHELESGNGPVERVRELARAALDVSEQFPDEVPPESLRQMIVRFPDLTLAMREPLREEAKERDDAAIEEVRRTLGLRN